jgi:hypothetical protein
MGQQAEGDGQQAAGSRQQGTADKGRREEAAGTEDPNPETRTLGRAPAKFSGERNKPDGGQDLDLHTGNQGYGNHHYGNSDHRS